MRTLIYWTIISFVSLAAPVFAAEPPASFADMVEKLSPAVVNISSTQKVKGPQGMEGTPFEDLPDTPEMEPFRNFFDRFGMKPGQNGMGGGQEQEHEVYSLGSGFIIDPKGFVITNNHVISDAEEVTVTLVDNTKYKAKVIGRDKKTDLALLKIEPKKDLPFVPLGNSDTMRVGDWVIAIGNPFGLGGSVTQGIISARERSINAGPFDDFLQTDAAINRGNSGGPLFNTHGEVIGINTAIYSPSGGSIGIGFAIPSSLAKPVIEQLKQFGRTHRGWLGVKIQEVSEEVAESIGLPDAKGALVLEVGKDSPADKVGIQAGDVITKFDGHDIGEMRFLPRMVAETKIGKTVDVTYWRKGSSKTVSITVGELDESEDAEDVHASKNLGKHAKQSETLLGLTLAPLTPELRQELRIDSTVSGVVVMDAKSDSEAAHRGIEAGDVIMSIGGDKIKTVDDLKKALDSARKQGRKNALARVVHEGEESFIALPVDEEKKQKENK